MPRNLALPSTRARDESVATARSVDPSAGNRRILHPGRNCWRVERCARAAFLVDGESYYRALADTFENAERAIYLLGWDFNSRVRLRRGADGAAPGGGIDSEAELASFLSGLVERKRDLHVYVLAWDFALLFALEREFLPLYRFGFRTHRRVHFRMDDRHPFAASQHQKVVVVDDRVAFCGGFDVTACRWDTPEHRAIDPRRHDDGSAPHAPFHDVQMMADGDVAAALGALARQRWLRATGDRLREPKPRAESDPWPASVTPAVRDVEVGIARTEAAYLGRPAVREVEALYMDAIGAAKNRIYIEQQYFTSSAVAEALAARLREPRGPEVVVIGPKNCSGWLEERTMGAIRAQLVTRLKESDRSGRLGIYHPVLPAQDGMHAPLNVHSKVLIVDDRMLRIGSSNMSNRSMGLDSECDLALEGADRETRDAIRRFAHRLLAEHLGAEPSAVSRSLVNTRSLIATIDELGRSERRLEPFDVACNAEMLVQAPELLDPAEPVEIDELSALLLAGDLAIAPARSTVRFVWGAVAMGALAALWLSSPLAPWRVATAPRLLVPQSLDVAALFFIYVTAALSFVPISLLTIGVGLIAGVRLGLAISLAGGWTGCLIGYGLGRALRRDVVRMLAGNLLDLARERLGSHPSMRTVARARLSPGLPFATVNLVAGASRVPAGAYLAGSVVGCVPVLIGLSLVTSTVKAALVESVSGGIGHAVLGAALLVLALGGLRLFLGHPRRRDRRSRHAGRR